MRWKHRVKQDKTSWHKWFAWFPVSVGDEVIWLETIHRKGKMVRGGYGECLIYEYRAENSKDST